MRCAVPCKNRQSPNYSMFAGDTFCPDSLIPFPTYRSPREDGKGFVWGQPEISATVAHFYFSERLRGIDGSARRGILDLPSASEARKVAQRLSANEQWTERRLDIVKAGLWAQFARLPGLAERLASGELPVGPAQALGRGWEARRRGDDRWKQAVLKTAQQFLVADRMRLLATGDTDLFNPFMFSSRLAVLLDGRRPAEVLIACRSGVDAIAEDWAIQNYVPVIHHPLRKKPGSPVSDEAIQALVAASTHAIVFTRGEDATIQQLRSRLHESRIPTRTILLDKDGRPLPKQTQSSRSGSRS